MVIFSAEDFRGPTLGPQDLDCLFRNGDTVLVTQPQCPFCDVAIKRWPPEAGFPKIVQIKSKTTIHSSDQNPFSYILEFKKGDFTNSKLENKSTFIIEAAPTVLHCKNGILRVMSGMSTEIDKDNILKFQICVAKLRWMPRGVISIDRFVLLTTDSELKPESDLPSGAYRSLTQWKQTRGRPCLKYNVGQLPALWTQSWAQSFPDLITGKNFQDVSWTCILSQRIPTSKRHWKRYLCDNSLRGRYQNGSWAAEVAVLEAKFTSASAASRTSYPNLLYCRRRPLA